MNGVPLLYVVREVEVPLAGIMYETHNERLINHAPLVGNYFVSDTRLVRTSFAGFIQAGEASKNWIRRIARFQDGRQDFIALQRHYAGQGNATKRIADAKVIQSSPHYKTERALPFGMFPDSLQKMFSRDFWRSWSGSPQRSRQSRPWWTRRL